MATLDANMSPAPQTTSPLWSVLKALFPYALAMILCGLLINWTFQLSTADLRYPLGDGDDGLVTQVLVQNLIERGAYYRCERIGAPYGVDLRDFPVSENLHLGVMKLLSAGTRNPYRIINYFYLLTFFLTTFTALFTFRRFGVAVLPGIVAALLYAFIPYHFYRGVTHLLLSAYYMIPPMVMVILWLYLGKLGKKNGLTSESTKVFWGRWVAALAICLLFSGAGTYYTFFGCFFVVTAAFACAIRDRRWTPLCHGGVLVSTIFLAFLANLLPCLLYQRIEGVDPDVSTRFKWESETYGLKLAHLLLPIPDHRLAEVRYWKQLYSYGASIQEGNFCAALGAVGAVGFVFVVLSFLFGRKTGAPRLLSGLGMLAVCGFFLGTVGGVGNLFANFVSPQLRGYNRVSIYLGFFAFFAVALFLTWLLDRARRWGLAGRFTVSGLCLLLLVGGVWDQTNPTMVPKYAATKAELDGRIAFVEQIERRLPPGAMVLQLPIIDFPERPPINGCGCYDHFRLYMVSHSVCWSHGTMRGRYGDKVLTQLGGKPVDVLVDRAVAMGYSGIHIDRFGYTDRGGDLEKRLRTLLGEEPLVSPDGRDAFFSLLRYAERIWSRYSEEEWTARQEWYRYPFVAALWGSGAYLPEGDWRWCDRSATLTLVNPLQKTRTVTLRFRPDFAPMDGKPQEPRPHLTITGPVLNGTVSVDTNAPIFSQEVTVPPGKHVLRFDCDGKPFRDIHGRTLVFRLMNLEVDGDDAPPDRYSPRRKFSDVPDIRLALSNPGTGAGIDGNAEVTMMPSTNGLVIQASSDDPNLILPAFTYDPNTTLLVRVDLTSPAATELDLFYQTTHEPIYSESKKASCPLLKGRNVVYLKLTEADLAGRLRLDPGTVPGEYILHAVEIRAVPRGSLD